MRQSELFTKTRKEAPADEVSRSAQLLIRAGYVAKEMAGVYSWLPLGMQTLDRVVNAIDREMRSLGATEVSLSALQDPAPWKTTGRWDDTAVDVWFKTKLKNESEVGLGLTHEEALARLLKDHITSYRDLPRYIYQFQTKFRNEVRAKSGLLRTREFLMKDLYSFTATAEGLDTFYDRVADAYTRIFQSLGIGDKTVKTFASGGAFSKYSHEFQTICPAGEDTIYITPDQKTAVNQEVFTDEVLNDLGKSKSDFHSVKAVEVGNIFKLGTTYSAALGLLYTDERGKQQPVVMGSYGIGPARVMATIAEVYSDDKGLIWPRSVAPYDVHLIEINPDHRDKISTAAQKLSEALAKKQVDVLHDDRELSPGQRFADADLIGIPTRVVISAKTLKAKKLEVKDRASGEVAMLSEAGLLKYLDA